MRAPLVWVLYACVHRQVRATQLTDVRIEYFSLFVKWRRKEDIDSHPGTKTLPTIHDCELELGVKTGPFKLHPEWGACLNIP